MPEPVLGQEWRLEARTYTSMQRSGTDTQGSWATFLDYGDALAYAMFQWKYGAGKCYIRQVPVVEGRVWMVAQIHGQTKQRQKDPRVEKVRRGRYTQGFSL